MAEESSAAEGSSIFESLFGGFSNGLSIFTNNPFRRKYEIEAGSTEGDAKLENADVSAPQMPKNAEDSVQQSVVGEEKQSQPEEKPSSTVKKTKKKAADDEEETGVEKKGRKTESEPEQRIKSGSSDSRKRNAEEQVGLDDTTSTEPKKKIKKKNATTGLESAEPQHDLRESTRKKRLNQDLLLSQGIDRKERKLEKTFAGVVEPAMKGEKESTQEVNLKQTPKRPQGQDGDENEKKKKSKRSGDINSEIPTLSKGEEHSIGGPPDPAVHRETRGSKRKQETNVEDLYEKKMRETVEGKEKTRAQEGSADLEVRGKRKLSDGGEDAETVSGALQKKKRKTREEERLDVEEQLKRTIFVGNLPMSIKPKHLLREFSQFGPVESARLRSVPLVDVSSMSCIGYVNKHLSA
jgi:hypothetical protein